MYRDKKVAKKLHLIYFIFKRKNKELTVFDVRRLLTCDPLCRSEMIFVLCVIMSNE